MISVGTSIWAYMQGVPTSIIAAIAFCIFVQAMYLTKLYEFTNVARKSRSPNLEIWRHRNELRLCEAACLLADVEPDLVMPDKNAQAWFGVLCEAIRKGELAYVRTMFDPSHTFQDGYRPYNETVISKDEFKKFVETRNLRNRFFKDVPF